MRVTTTNRTLTAHPQATAVVAAVAEVVVVGATMVGVTIPFFPQSTFPISIQGKRMWTL